MCAIDLLMLVTLILAGSEIYSSGSSCGSSQSSYEKSLPGQGTKLLAKGELNRIFSASAGNMTVLFGIQVDVLALPSASIQDNGNAGSTDEAGLVADGGVANTGSEKVTQTALIQQVSNIVNVSLFELCC